MRIRVINPNTTESMTARIEEAAKAAASPATRITAVQPAMGPVSIEGHYDEAMCLPGLIELVRAGEAAGEAGYLIACFGDPGLGAAREIARGPVLGIAEAAMHAASMIATGFSVVTTLGRTEVITEHLVVAYGMERHCRRVRSTELAVLDLEDPASDARRRILETCRRAIEEDRCGAIVLGCAGMADLARDLSNELGIPVIDGVAVGVRMLEALIGCGLTTSKRGDYAFPEKKVYKGTMAGFAPG